MTTFLGTVASDFMKKVELTDLQKTDLIDYAGTDFISLRSTLIDYIKAAYPLDYQNFSESDLGMMLIELVAYMGAVLSLKADLLANENYLATAQNRHNVKKLLELIGIRMRGPTSAASNARLTFSQTIGVTDFVSLRDSSRTTTITSPQDGNPISYTLYKVVGGKIQDLNNLTGELILYANEASNPASPAVWNNVALIEGALVTQTGSFESYGNGVPTISLTKAPVIDGSVQVVVDAPGDPDASGIYTQVESIFFASGATDKIFQVNLDDSFGGVVVFGDGISGRRPPPAANYYLNYRIGGGSRGNIQESTLNVPALGYTNGLDGGSNAATLENTSLATGGADAESIAHAKKYGPLFFKSQDRLVTLEDYVSQTNKYVSNYSTVGKATAAVRKAYSSANVIDVYVLEKATDLQLQKASSSFKISLLEFLNEKKMLTDEIIIVDGIIRTLDLIITVKCDRELKPREEEIKASVRNILLNYFNVDSLDFGQDLAITDLNRTIFQGVDEVRFSSIDNINTDITVDFNEIIQLNNFTINVVFV